MRGSLLFFPFELGAFAPPYRFERMRCHCSVMRVPVIEILKSAVNPLVPGVHLKVTHA